MAFPKNTLLENFSDGKKPTQAQWYQLLEQIRPYVSSSIANPVQAQLKNLFTTNTVVTQAAMSYILTYCKLARPFATDYDALEAKFTTGSKPTGADFETLINALNYTQLPCVIQFYGIVKFNNASSSEYHGHVLGITVESAIDPTAVSGTKLVLLATNGGNWSILDAYTMGNTLPLISGWLSDVTFSKITMRVILANTAQAQKVQSAKVNLYMAKTESDTNRTQIVTNVIATQKDYNGLVVEVPNVTFSQANYADIVSQTGFIFCTADVTVQQ